MFNKIAALLTPSAADPMIAPQRPKSDLYAVYLTDSEANTLRMMLSGAAKQLQKERSVSRTILRLMYNLSDKDRADEPLVAEAFAALNAGKDYVRSNRRAESRINGMIRAIRQRHPV